MVTILFEILGGSGGSIIHTDIQQRQKFKGKKP
jgi:hypothetical protein